MIEKYIQSLQNEITFRSESFRFPVSTVYFGGGTPSLLKPHQLEKIMLSVFNSFDVAADTEITCECNPDDLSFDYLKNICESGINRLSIGVQSLQDYDLQTMCRRHHSAQAIKAVEQSAKAGFRNIGVDLIYGLPWSNRTLFAENLKLFASLPVQHLSAYHLTIEEGTPFFQRNMKNVDNDESLAQYLLLCETLNRKGMEHYEISNFCMPDFYSRHNSSYWNDSPYLGLGAGAHSYYDGKRYWNQQNVELYCSNQFDSVREDEILSKTDLFNEQIMLGLRTKRGVDLAKIQADFTCFIAEFNVQAKKWQERGALYIENNHLICNEEKWFIVDRVIEDFIIV